MVIVHCLGCWGDSMLERFSEVWSTLGDIISALPADVVTVVCTVFILVGVVGALRTI